MLPHVLDIRNISCCQGHCHDLARMSGRKQLLLDRSRRLWHNLLIRLHFRRPAKTARLATITTKGQLTTPKAIREALGIEQKDKLLFLLGRD